MKTRKEKLEYLNAMSKGKIKKQPKGILTEFKGKYYKLDDIENLYKEIPFADARKLVPSLTRYELQHSFKMIDGINTDMVSVPLGSRLKKGAKPIADYKNAAVLLVNCVSTQRDIDREKIWKEHCSNL